MEIAEVSFFLFFFFLSFNFSDVSRAAWKRYLNPFNCQSTWWSLQGGFNFFLACGQNRVCGVTIQMKPLQWYFHMVTLFFSIWIFFTKWNIEIFFDEFLSLASLDKNMWTKSCSVIVQMKPLWQHFHVVLFIFQHFTKWNFGIFWNFFTLCFFGSVRLIIRFRVLRVNLSPMPKFPLDPSS